MENPQPPPPTGPLPPKEPSSGGQSPKAAVPRPPLAGTLVPMILLGVCVIAIWLWARRDENGKRDDINYSTFIEHLEAGDIGQVEFRGGLLLWGLSNDGLAEERKAKASKSAGESSDKTASTPASKPVAKPAEADSKTDDTAQKSESKAAAAKPDPLPKRFAVILTPVEDFHLNERLLAKHVEIVSNLTVDSNGIWMAAYLLGTLLFIGVVLYTLRRTRDQIIGGGGILSGFSKSPARRFENSKKQTTFADVAGLESIKNDLQEIVEFLKAPEKFTRLGGRVPKGILLMGPPGTGKTLLARAVAGEAGVPFFSISGSEFIQMFVGVGASRVRDLFKTAKEASPAILFIDEIDAVGRHRGTGLGGGHDEREQTLNQILSEMDGFLPNESVIVLAATNRPDVLDPALLRPGRFDRHITVDRPNMKARVAIFKVHSRNVPLAPDVNLERMAAGTVGLTGADIRNLVNEAALWATRNGKDRVDMSDFEFARDKVLMGPKREEVLMGKEKTMTAYHEAGHALLAWILPGVDRVHKVTIIPRGRALGVTHLVPEEDRVSIGQSELNSRLIFVMGGRAAEKLVFDEYSAGAENDLTQATKLARLMVTSWGMSERLGPVAYRSGEQHPFLGREIQESREYSDHTAQVIDEEVARILQESAAKALELLKVHRDKLDSISQALEKSEVLDEAELTALIGPSANTRALANGKPAAAAVR